LRLFKTSSKNSFVPGLFPLCVVPAGDAPHACAALRLSGDEHEEGPWLLFYSKKSYTSPKIFKESEKSGNETGITFPRF